MNEYKNGQRVIVKEEKVDTTDDLMKKLRVILSQQVGKLADISAKGATLDPMQIKSLDFYAKWVASIAAEERQRATLLSKQLAGLTDEEIAKALNTEPAKAIEEGEADAD